MLSSVTYFSYGQPISKALIYEHIVLMFVANEQPYMIILDLHKNCIIQKVKTSLEGLNSVRVGRNLMAALNALEGTISFLTVNMQPRFIQKLCQLQIPSVIENHSVIKSATRIMGFSQSNKFAMILTTHLGSLIIFLYDEASFKIDQMTTVEESSEILIEKLDQRSKLVLFYRNSLQIKEQRIVYEILNLSDSTRVKYTHSDTEADIIRVFHIQEKQVIFLQNMRRRVPEQITDGHGLFVLTKESGKPSIIRQLSSKQLCKEINYSKRLNAFICFLWRDKTPTTEVYSTDFKLLTSSRHNISSSYHCDQQFVFGVSKRQEGMTAFVGLESRKSGLGFLYKKRGMDKHSRRILKKIVQLIE